MQFFFLVISMNSHDSKHEQTEDNVPSIKYKVFHSDSEEEAKLMAISSIYASLPQNDPSFEQPWFFLVSMIKGFFLPLILCLIITAFVFLLHNQAEWYWFTLAYTFVFVFTIKHFVAFCRLLYQKILSPSNITRQTDHQDPNQT